MAQIVPMQEDSTSTKQQSSCDPPPPNSAEPYKPETEEPSDQGRSQGLDRPYWEFKCFPCLEQEIQRYKMRQIDPEGVLAHHRQPPYTD